MKLLCLQKSTFLSQYANQSLLRCVRAQLKPKMQPVAA